MASEEREEAQLSIDEILRIFARKWVASVYGPDSPNMRELERIIRESPEKVLPDARKKMADDLIATISQLSHPASGVAISFDFYEMYPANIKVLRELPTAAKTYAATDDEQLLVNPYVFAVSGRKESAFTVAHEIMHGMCAQVHRGLGKYPWIWNLAADVFVNERLREMGFDPGRLKDELIFYDTLVEILKKKFHVPDEYIRPREWVLKVGDEEIYNWLVSVLARFTGNVGGADKEIGDIFKKIGGGDVGGEVDRINREYEEAKKEGRGSEFRNRIEGEAIRRLERSIREAGKVGSDILFRNLDHIVRETVVNWRELLAEGFSAAQKQPIQTWLRPSRRLPGLWPGHKWIGYGRVIVLVDLSGSITNNTAKRFLGEVRRLAEEYTRDIVVIAWDTQILGELDLFSLRLRYKGGEKVFSSLDEALRFLGSRGGGGTRIDPALERALELTDPTSTVVVLTDGVIDKTPRTRSLSDDLVANSARCVLIYTTDPAYEIFGPDWVRAIMPVED